MAYNQAVALTLLLGAIQGGQVNSSNPSGPGNFQTSQLIGPWGQTQACLTWEEMFNQLRRCPGVDSGKLGLWLNFGIVNGPTPTPYNQTFANVTFTNGSPTISGLSSTLGLTPGMLAFCSVAGLVGIAYVLTIASATSITINQNFGGTTGSTYTLTLVPCPPASANDIISSP